ncbi:MAG: hypothetical protein ACRD3S_08665 [Terracidiphilus sp.]
MAQSIMVFDFGANEEAAQQAKHKVEAWKQGFRLGNKMLLKFEREENADYESAADESESAESAKTSSGAAKSAKKKSGEKRGAKSKTSAKQAAEPAEESAPESNGKVRLLLRLDFSDHEKLSHQRWLDSIPSEEPFKSADGQTIRTGDPEFPRTSELFESLD